MRPGTVLTSVSSLQWHGMAGLLIPCQSMRKLPDCLTKPSNFSFVPGPAENFGLSDKCPATLRKSQMLKKKTKKKKKKNGVTNAYIKKEYLNQIPSNTFCN